MIYQLSVALMQRKTAKGNTRRFHYFCVHPVGSRSWEGAGFKKSDKAWAYLAHLNTLPRTSRDIIGR